MARTYGDRCGVARALDAVGERWALLVVRELLLGPKRFSDLRAGLPHVSADILAARLRELEQSGSCSAAHAAAAGRLEGLRAHGARRAALEPVVLALGRWGCVAPFPPAEDARIGVDAFVIALKTLYAGGGSGRYALVLDGAAVHRGRRRTSGGSRGEARDPDGVIAARRASWPRCCGTGAPWSPPGSSCPGALPTSWSSSRSRRDNRGMHSEEWTEVEVVERYLSRADAFPHRLEGEQVLLDHLPAGARRVLDLGAGDGRLLAMVLRERPEATGVALDFSDVMLAAARERFAGDDRVEIVQHNLVDPLPSLGRVRRRRLLDGHPPPRGRAQARGLRRGVRAARPRAACSRTSST